MIICICSCHLWVSVNYVCAYYMAVCYMAGKVEWAKVFGFAVGFSGVAADLHFDVPIGVAA